MQSSFTSTAIRLFRYLDALQIAFIRAVLEQPKCRKALRLGLLVVFLLYMVSQVTASADDSLLQLDKIDDKFRGLQNGWYSIVKGFAMGLFWKLALVDFCWSTVIYVLDKNEMPEILHALVRKIFNLGFFFSLLKLSDEWIPAIIKSFITIGKAASNVGDLTPDGIVNKGLDLALGSFQMIKSLGAFDKMVVVFPVTFMALLIFLAFLWVAAQLLVTLIESYIAIGLGVILLGFGGSRWTTDFATKYLQFAVGTGIKLMVLYAIVGGGQSLFGSLMIDADQLIKSCMVVLGVAGIYTYLAINVPQLATAMMSGSPNLTAGSLAGTAATVAGAAVGAGALAATAGAAGVAGAMGGAAGAGGLAQALGAGLNSAADHGKTGLAAAGHAAKEVASHGLGLATGAASGAAGSAKTAFADKLGQSTGGKIASSIEATRGGSVQGASAPANAGGGAGPTPAGGNAGADAGGQGEAAGAEPAQDSGAQAGSSGVSAGGDAAAATAASSPAPAAVSPAAQSANPSGATGKAVAAQPIAAGPSGSAVGPSGAPTAASAVAPAAGVGGPAAAASGSTPTAPPAPASNSQAAPTPQPAQAPDSAVAPASGGDASSAALSPTEDGASAAGNAGGQQGQQGERKPSAGERIRNLEGYVPQDAAGNAAININIGHARD